MLAIWSRVALTTIPPTPYIRSPSIQLPIDSAAVPRLDLSHPVDLKVGVAWAARHDHGTGLRRTIPFEEVLPLLSLPKTKFYSLQAGQGPATRDIDRTGAMYLIERCKAKDFSELAQLISEMDVIVSADTSPLHLAGAMGKPTIGLLSRDGSDWRWLSHHTTSSPWYPSVKLIRQQEVGKWNPVIEQARELLRQRDVGPQV